MSHSGSDVTTIRHSKADFLPTTARFEVEVVEGDDYGARLIIEPEAACRVLIGKSEACALRLSDPQISRRHAAMSVHGSELHLCDLRSMNGVYVGSLRVTEAFLRGGEIIVMGQSRLSITRRGEVAEQVTGPDRFGRLLGISPQMRRLYPLLARLAQGDVPVVIEGETGTGKEVVAEALHEQGSRARGPFVVFDCTAVAPNLIEAALFGHEKGAFTGASTTRKGVFEEAHGGTLFIDEIGDLELSLQSKLLRAIQRKEIRRVGGDRWIQVDVRVLAATRRDLDREVQNGRFREDLFYRLAVARIELPPLRERAGDIALLARIFWDRLAGPEEPIPYEQFAAWEDYHWPGNVRELENAVARRAALGELAPKLGLAWQAEAPAPSTKSGTLLHVPFDIDKPLAVVRERIVEMVERRYVELALAAHGGQSGDAAARAGVTRRYLNMLRTRFGL